MKQVFLCFPRELKDTVQVLYSSLEEHDQIEPYFWNSSRNSTKRVDSDIRNAIIRSDLFVFICDKDYDYSTARGRYHLAEIEIANRCKNGSGKPLISVFCLSDDDQVTPEGQLPPELRGLSPVNRKGPAPAWMHDHIVHLMGVDDVQSEDDQSDRAVHSPQERSLERMAPTLRGWLSRWQVLISTLSIAVASLVFTVPAVAYYRDAALALWIFQACISLFGAFWFVWRWLDQEFTSTREFLSIDTAVAETPIRDRVQTALELSDDQLESEAVLMHGRKLTTLFVVAVIGVCFSWFVVYASLVAERVGWIADLSILRNIANDSSTMFMVAGFFVMTYVGANPDRHQPLARASKVNNRLANLFVVLFTVFFFYEVNSVFIAFLIPGGWALAATAIGGVAGATAFGLWLARLDSRFVDPSTVVLTLLFVYAALQPAWALLDTGSRHYGGFELLGLEVLIAPVALGILGLALKSLMMLFLAWLASTGRLLFYFWRSRVLSTEAVESWHLLAYQTQVHPSKVKQFGGLPGVFSIWSGGLGTSAFAIGAAWAIALCVMHFPAPDLVGVQADLEYTRTSQVIGYLEEKWPEDFEPPVVLCNDNKAQDTEIKRRLCHVHAQLTDYRSALGKRDLQATFTRTVQMLETACDEERRVIAPRLPHTLWHPWPLPDLVDACAEYGVVLEMAAHINAVPPAGSPIARSVYEKACGRDHMKPWACSRLAAALRKEGRRIGDPTLIIKSARIDGDVCEKHSFAPSCNGYGLRLHAGEAGDAANEETARAHVLRACVAGYGNGCDSLAYLEGQKGEQSRALSRDLYKAACMKGEIRSCLNIASNTPSLFGEQTIPGSDVDEFRLKLVKEAKFAIRLQVFNMVPEGSTAPALSPPEINNAANWQILVVDPCGAAMQRALDNMGISDKQSRQRLVAESVKGATTYLSQWNQNPRVQVRLRNTGLENRLYLIDNRRALEVRYQTPKPQGGYTGTFYADPDSRASALASDFDYLWNNAATDLSLWLSRNPGGRCSKPVPGSKSGPTGAEPSPIPN